jgi:hypothetical protein
MVPMNRAQAEESVAARFTRVMNATPSPWGIYSDFVLAGVTGGLIAFGGLLVGPRLTRPETAVGIVIGLVIVPFLVSASVSYALQQRSRTRVIDWVSKFPFEIVNLNAVLAGLGDTLELTFREDAVLPARSFLQPRLERISEDLLVTAEQPDQRLIQIRLGIIDSKHLPQRTNHARWVRFCATMDQVVVALHETNPIVRVVVV